MTDDIVADLRNRAKHCKEDLERDVESFILRQAADEIERLEERCARLERTVEALMEIMEERRDEFIRFKKKLTNDG